MHTPVLLKESLDLLEIREGDVYFDATIGEGGHAEEVFKRFGKKVEIVGIDADSSATESSRKRLEGLGASPKLEVLNFRNINEILDKPNKILFDLGWNKGQFENGERGFSFQKDQPLKMNFGETQFTAFDIVNSWDEENIAAVLEGYGEERFAKKIAQKIVEARKISTIKTSLQLVEIIKSATPKRYHFQRIHPATRTFQALRITVNDELMALEEGLKKAFEILPPRGRVAVISFHSLEDRIVKKFFKHLEVEEKVVILTKKPIVASESEIKENPRSRSAKLRGIEKI